MISIWNSTAYSIRGGASVKTSIATAAAACRRVIPYVTAYIAHPDAAQNRRSVTLYARYGLPVHQKRGPTTIAGVTSGSAKVRLRPYG